MAARAVALPEESAQKHSGNVDQSPHTKQFPERKRRNARARKRRRETEQTKVGGDRTHSADRTTKRHTRNGADLPRRSASKACSSSIRDRWLGPCCSVRAAAQRLRSFLGRRRRRRRRRRRCSADPSHDTATDKRLLYHVCSHQASATEGRQTMYTGYSESDGIMIMTYVLLTAFIIEYNAYITCSPSEGRCAWHGRIN